MNPRETVARELYDHKLDPLGRKNVLENISYDDVKFPAHKLLKESKKRIMITNSKK